MTKSENSANCRHSNCLKPENNISPIQIHRLLEVNDHMMRKSSGKKQKIKNSHSPSISQRRKSSDFRYRAYMNHTESSLQSSQIRNIIMKPLRSPPSNHSISQSSPLSKGSPHQLNKHLSRNIQINVLDRSLDKLGLTGDSMLAELKNRIQRHAGVQTDPNPVLNKSS